MDLFLLLVDDAVVIAAGWRRHCRACLFTGRKHSLFHGIPSRAGFSPGFNRPVETMDTRYVNLERDEAQTSTRHDGEDSKEAGAEQGKIRAGETRQPAGGITNNHKNARTRISAAGLEKQPPIAYLCQYPDYLAGGIQSLTVYESRPVSARAAGETSDQQHYQSSFDRAPEEPTGSGLC